LHLIRVSKVKKKKRVITVVIFSITGNGQLQKQTTIPIWTVKGG